MEFRKVLALRGPNIWTNAPVIEAWVELNDLDRPSTDFPGFSDRPDKLAAQHDRAPLQHRYTRRFFQRLRDGTYPGIFSNTSRWNCSRWPAGKSVSDVPAKPRSRASIAWSSSTTMNNWRCMPARGAGTHLGGDPRSALQRQGRDRAAAATSPMRPALDPAPVRLLTRRRPAAFPCGG